jgi:DNA transposition AAA+ family ATPase
MKTNQLIETENVKNANKVLKNLLERTRTEIVGLGLFYGQAGFGKTRWGSKTAQANGYIYLRLEANITVKDFLISLLSKLIHKTMPYYEIVGSANVIYSQILDYLQSNMDTVIIIDELDYAYSRSNKILASIRDLADQSLVTFVLIGMEKAKRKLLKMDRHYFDRTNAFYEFQPLLLSDTELIIKELCEVIVDEHIINFIHSKSNGTIRIINKYIDALERIAKRMKKDELTFEEIIAIPLDISKCIHSA